MGVFIMCNKDQKIRDLEREVVELREEKDDLSAENITLHGLYRSKRSEADRYWASYKKQGEIIIDLQSENEVLKKQHANQRDTILKLQEELLESRTQRLGYKTMCDYRMDALNKAQQKVRDLEAEVKSLKNENAKLSAGWADFDALYEKLNALNSERDQAIKEKVHLGVICDGLLTENQRLKNDRTYLHTELAKRANKIDELETKIDDITDEYEVKIYSLNHKLDMYELATHRLNDVIKELHKQIDELKAKNDGVTIKCDINPDYISKSILNSIYGNPDFKAPHFVPVSTLHSTAIHPCVKCKNAPMPEIKNVIFNDPDDVKGDD